MQIEHNDTIVTLETPKSKGYDVDALIKMKVSATKLAEAIAELNEHGVDYTVVYQDDMIVSKTYGSYDSADPDYENSNC